MIVDPYFKHQFVNMYVNLTINIHRECNCNIFKLTDFTAAQYADIIYVYEYCNGNSLYMCREYHRKFTSRHQPSVKVIARTFQRLSETGTTVKNYGVFMRTQIMSTLNEIIIIGAVLDHAYVFYTIKSVLNYSFPNSL